MADTSTTDPKEIRERVQQRFCFADVSRKPLRELFRICVDRGQEGIAAQSPGTRPPAGEGAFRDLPELPEDLNVFFRNHANLPSLPHVFSQIMSVMSDPRSSAKDFAQIIMEDPALTARLLKLVNSPFYGFRSKIDTITRAVAVIGTQELYALCLATSVVKTFRHIPDNLVELTSFWRHSIACGIFAHILAGSIGMKDRERFFVAGLLHDIGRLIMYQHLTLHAGAALVRARQSEMLLIEAEKEILGFDHASIAGVLMKRWRLPEALYQIVRNHHEPMEALDPPAAAVVHLSDIIVNALQIGSSGERLVPRLDPHAWDLLKMPADKLPEIVATAEAHMETVIKALQ